MQPLDKVVHYGRPDRSDLNLYEIEGELLPDKLRQLRWKLNQKAKREPKYRFYTLYDRIYRPDVLRAAWKQVSERKKSPGVDGVRAEDILDKEGEEEVFLQTLHEELKSKSYRPSPVKRVYIPKGDGSKRPLGIPTLKDRVVQMAVLLILEPIFEADFEDCSHGFRPKRKAHDALAQIRANLKEGRTAVYDADLKGYFDSIPHDKLMASVRMRVTDRSLLGLIRSWLRGPIVETDEKTGKQLPPSKGTGKGTPQGGVISPLLANVYLHWMDVLFHRSEGPFQWANARLIRYADDFVVMARYQGRKISEWLEAKLEGWMELTINREKTKVVNLHEGDSLEFLGYTFRFDRDLHGGKHRYLNVFASNKSLKKAREVIREMTGPKHCFKPTPQVVEELNSFLRGWSSYFSYGYPPKAMRAIGSYAYQRMGKHLNRRSQRKYHRPPTMTNYAHLKQLGLLRL